MKQLIEWLEQHQIPCVYQKLLGVPCPACGLQRSFIELLKGNIAESFMIYPPLLPVMILFLVLCLHLVFRFRRGGQWLKILSVLTGTIMIINYFFVIFSH